MEHDLVTQKGKYEGRYYNFDVMLVPSQNSSKQVALKKSFQTKFMFHDPAQLTEKSHNSVFVIARVPFQPFYIPSQNGQFVGIDVDSWKIIISHLKLKVEFLEAKNNGETINMVRTRHQHCIV